MAAHIEVIDGFEDYPGLTTAGVGLGSYWLLNAPWALTTGRVGGQCVQVAGTSNYIAKQLEPATDKAIFFAFKPITTLVDWEAIFFRLANGATTNSHFSLGMDAALNLYVIDATGTEIARVPSGGLLLNTWASVSLAWHSSTTVGTLKVWINGELIADITNANLQHSSATTANRMYMHGIAGGSAASNSSFFDDVRVDTETTVQIPEGRYAQLTYAADDSVAWTPSSGASNYLMIDEATCDSNTTYNVSNTVGAIDKFTVNALSFNPDKIYAVVVAIASRKEDVATRRTQCFLESGADSFHSDDKFETTDFTWQWNILETNPDGAIEWTKTDLAAIKVGYELIE